MNNSKPAASTGTSDREIYSTRLLNAPRELVFKVWSDPEHLKDWWGPKGFMITFHEFDFREGGHWRFIMHGPDGKNYKNHSVFVEIVEPERIVFRHFAPNFLATVTFADQGAKTLMTWRGVFETVEAIEQVKGFAVNGHEESVDRLAEYLAKGMKEES